ncbi:MAG: hypothetical protein NXI07_11530 [bacterium]|nr:hypothetical protein [bacterium]
MDTHHTHDDRYVQLLKTNARWRLLAVSALTLMAGIGIGGMGSGQPELSTSPDDPMAVIDYVGTSDRIFRIHADGSLTYLKIPEGERTGFGYYDWGKIKIDDRYTSRTLPQP